MVVPEVLLALSERNKSDELINGQINQRAKYPKQITKMRSSALGSPYIFAMSFVSSVTTLIRRQLVYFVI